MTQESTVATHLSNVGVIVLIPQSFTDQEKSMYLAFRDEMRIWNPDIYLILVYLELYTVER